MKSESERKGENDRSDNDNDDDGQINKGATLMAKRRGCITGNNHPKLQDDGLCEFHN